MVNNIRQKLESGLGAAGDGIYRHPWVALLVIVIFFIMMASGLKNLTIDTSTEGFLHADDPTLLTYFDFRDQYGRDEMLQLTIVSDNIFSDQVMSKIKNLHNEIKHNVPHLNDVTSLINARNTTGNKGALIVDDLIADDAWPQTLEDWQRIKTVAIANPIYKNLLLSEDGTITTIAIKTNAYSDGEEQSSDALLEGGDELFSEESGVDGAVVEERLPLSDKENGELVKAISDIVQHYQSDDFKIYLAGGPVVTATLKNAMTTNMKRFVVTAIATIALILFVLFRRVSGVVLPLLTVVLSVLSTVGLMGHLGIPIKLPTQILPSFLLAVGVGASVHLLAIFYRRLQHNSSPEYPRGDARDAIAYATSHSGLAILMTSITTAAGLASFAGSGVAPVSDLGYIAASGVMISFVFVIFMTPILVSIFSIQSTIDYSHDGEHNKDSWIDDALVWIASFSIHNSGKIIVVSVLILIFSFIGVSQVRFSHEPYKWLPEDEPSRIATEFVNEHMKGASSAEIVIDTGRENGLYDPKVMQGISQLGKELETIQYKDLYVGKTLSLADTLKEINKALNENKNEYYSVPNDRKLIAQEFLLFENSGSDDLEDMVDSQFQQSRFTIKMPWGDSVNYDVFVAKIEDKFNSILGDDVTVTVTGMAVLLGETVVLAMKSMADGYLIAATIITFMMIILLGNIRMGLFSMIPNLTPIIFILGLMGWFDLRLDLFTMLIGSIAIGLAVDDTIHFMHNYRRYYKEYGDLERAVKETLLSTGRAMLVTSIVLSTGFYLYMFSTLNILFNFGLLTGTAIVVALLSDFFLAPAMLQQLHKYNLIKSHDEY
ncbi:MAG: MMPL family transporter [Chromatiales bacterium]|nr:MMPL family transporter [Chromatiales bacterium]